MSTAKGNQPIISDYTRRRLSFELGRAPTTQQVAEPVIYMLGQTLLVVSIASQSAWY